MIARYYRFEQQANRMYLIGIDWIMIGTWLIGWYEARTQMTLDLTQHGGMVLTWFTIITPVVVEVWKQNDDKLPGEKTCMVTTKFSAAQKFPLDLERFSSAGPARLVLARVVSMLRRKHFQEANSHYHGAHDTEVTRAFQRLALWFWWIKKMKLWTRNMNLRSKECHRSNLHPWM